MNEPTARQVLNQLTSSWALVTIGIRQQSPQRHNGTLFEGGVGGYR